MPNAINLNKDILYELYINKKISKKNIAKILSCSIDSVDKYIKKYGIPKRAYFSTRMADAFNLSKDVLDIIQGALLGDGSLPKTLGNSQFTYCSSKKDHVGYIAGFIREYLTPETKEIKTVKIFDKRTNREYTRYIIRTVNNETFTLMRKKWYPNGVKIIPEDLKLNKTIMLIWYLGDGGISYTKKKGVIRSCQLKLSTQGFNVQDIKNVLLPQMLKYKAFLCKADNGQYTIRIPRTKAHIFLKDIGVCPVESLKYRWDVPVYKRDISTFINHKENKEKFVNMYKKGFTYYRIAKVFNIEPSAVRHHLIMSGVYKNQA